MSAVKKRIESIDLLRGIVMIIMALDHVRDYFSRDAFLFDPTDMNKTNGVHVPGHGPLAFFWSFLHEPGNYTFGHTVYLVRYPVLPWIGVITLGYYFGGLYVPGYDPEMRKVTLLSLGFGAISLFLVLRSGNLYGDAAHWSNQDNALLTFCSFLNVTKYPPSLLYILMTLGPAMIFLVVAERWQPCITRPVPFSPLKRLREKTTVFGRVPMFYYLAHIYLIHGLAVAAVALQGYNASDMILASRVNQSYALKGYGFDLGFVYLVWAGVIIILYPLCQYYDRYKRAHLRRQWWLSYL